MDGWFYGRTADGWCWRELATGFVSIRPPPFVQEPWRAQWDASEEAFYFNNPEGEETFGLPPVVPDGWRARWCDRHSVFWFIHAPIGRTFWELDAPVLQSQQLLGVSDLVYSDVRRSYRQAALRLHPDKGGDQAVWRETQERFESVTAKLGAMAAHGGSR